MIHPSTYRFGMATPRDPICIPRMSVDVLYIPVSYDIVVLLSGAKSSTMSSY